MNKRMLAAVGCLAIASACSNTEPGGLFPPGQPTPQSVFQSQQEFDAVWDKFGQTEQERAAGFTLFGYKRASDACQIFFEKVRKMQNETTFAKDTLVAASAAAGVISGLSGVATNVLTALFAGTGLIPSTVDNFNKIFLLSAAADELAGQVFAGMDDYQSKHPATSTLTKEDAIRNVRSNASWCSIAFMNYLVKASVGSVKANNKTDTGTGTGNRQTESQAPPGVGASVPGTTQVIVRSVPSPIGRFGGIEISR